MWNCQRVVVEKLEIWWTIWGKYMIEVASWKHNFLFFCGVLEPLMKRAAAHGREKSMGTLVAWSIILTPRGHWIGLPGTCPNSWVCLDTPPSGYPPLSIQKPFCDQSSIEWQGIRFKMFYSVFCHVILYVHILKPVDWKEQLICISITVCDHNSCVIW